LKKTNVRREECWEDQQERLIRLMRKEFKYYQTAHPSLLLETNKMNAVDDNESENIQLPKRNTL
jgi:hypothetical protein